MLLNVQLAGVACIVMDVRKPLLHGLDTLRGLLTDEAPRQFGNEASFWVKDDMMGCGKFNSELVEYDESHPDSRVNKICTYTVYGFILY